MRPKPLLALACCSLILLASPGLADEAKVEAKGQIAALWAPARCVTPTTGIPEPSFMTCTVQIECADTSVVSCSGNSCSTGGINNRCVICDSVQHGCCPVTCCEQCQADWEACDGNCPDWPLICARACQRAYNNCVAGCTGGCS